MNKKITFAAPAENIFTSDNATDKKASVIPFAPIMNYNGFIRPQEFEEAKEIGTKCAEEIKNNIIADFEKTSDYCKIHDGENVDLMVHVSTFKIIDGIVYMTYYANTASDSEDPSKQEARFAFCTLDNPSDMTIVRIQKVGDMLDGKKIDMLYDTILMYKGGDEIFLMWTASADGMYYRLYSTYNIKTGIISEIRPNRFKAGEITNDFSTSGMTNALAANNLPIRKMFVDIGIMQKITTRVENGETYYYTGAYSGYFNCIIKSRDFVTWEYVAAPDFVSLALWENATYVLGDKCYYFVRQNECEQGFLTCYDLSKKTWAVPFLIKDTQSRSDFIFYKNELYLIHAPVNREGFGIIKVNRDDLSKSVPVLVADMESSFFYPFTDIYGNDAYISYTVDRKHIRLSKFNLENYLK